MSSLIVEFVTDLGKAHGGWNGVGEKKAATETGQPSHYAACYVAYSRVWLGWIMFDV